MNKVDTEVVKFALSTSPHKSDAEIAKLASVPEKEVAALRTSLGITVPEGNETMKEAARIYLKSIPLQEKIAKLKQMDIQDVWEMAEGKAATTGTLEVKQDPVHIDITHLLLKAYGPTDGASATILPHPSESLGLPAGSGE